MNSYEILDCDDEIAAVGLERQDRRGPWTWRQHGLSTPKIPSPFVREIAVIAQQCCQEHPGISLDRGIFGGAPHIREVRISVSDILVQVYLLGSLQAVVDYYSSEISLDQVREAIAYAQDFLEISLSTT
jgi:uncharacterized protein (DUF433 family)